MSTIKVNSGPHKALAFIGHASAEEYDKQANEVGACVATADLSDIYRSLLPEAHEKFAEVLKKSGVVRGVNEKATLAAKQKAKDATSVKDVEEPYVQYANRVKAVLESGNGVSAASGASPEQIAEAVAAGKKLWADLDDEIHAIAATMAVDASPAARAKGPDKQAVAKAEDILSRSPDAITTTVDKLLATVGDFDLVRDENGIPDVTSLARLIQEWVKTSL